MDCNCKKITNANKKEKKSSDNNTIPPTPNNNRLPFYADYLNKNKKTECEGACDLVKRVDNYNNNLKKFYSKNQKGINELPQRTKQMMYITRNYTQ